MLTTTQQDLHLTMTQGGGTARRSPHALVARYQELLDEKRPFTAPPWDLFTLVGKTSKRNLVKKIIFSFAN